jgi:hypothetical protein
MQRNIIYELEKQYIFILLYLISFFKFFPFFYTFILFFQIPEEVHATTSPYTSVAAATPASSKNSLYKNPQKKINTPVYHPRPPFSGLRQRSEQRVFDRRGQVDSPELPLLCG